MRGLVTGLVACCVVASGGDAVARNEWVVLRVERVEVAVAHADGSPWDDADPNGSQAGPDLAVRLAIDGGTQYVSAIAQDRVAHDFAYAFLLPIELIPADELSIEVFDQDGIEIRRGEPLGTVRLMRSDIDDLLGNSSRVKTFSDDAVTRLEVTARRYTRRSRRRTATARPDKGEVLLAPTVVAGELVEVRASSAAAVPTVIFGAAQDRIAVGRCTRVLVTGTGRVAATVDGSSANPVRFELRVLRPSLAMWTRAEGWVPCDGRRDMHSVAAISQLVTFNGSTLDPAAITPIIRSRYLAGVQRCHERALRQDPMAAGRMSVHFTVGPTGGVVKAMANGLDRTLEACIESLIVKWRFAAPKDAQGDPASEDVDAEVVLHVR